jgi:hypothetical protein
VYNRPEHFFVIIEIMVVCGQNIFLVCFVMPYN